MENINSNIPYGLLAELLLAAHFAYVLFVVFGLLVVWIGYFCSWNWVRNPVFRYLHLLAIGFVLLEALLGVVCPLTIWEGELRELAGGEHYHSSFLAYWTERLMYFDFPPQVFLIAYAAFFVLVVGSLLLIPPHPLLRWFSRERRRL